MDGPIVFARWHQCVPPSSTCILGPPVSTSQMASRSVQLVLHGSWQGVPILYNGSQVSPSKLPLHMGAKKQTWFPGLPEFKTQTASQLVQPFLQGSLHHRDRQSDRQTDEATLSVTIGCIYIVLQCGLKTQINDNWRSNTVLQQSPHGHWYMSLCAGNLAENQHL